MIQVVNHKNSFLKIGGSRLVVNHRHARSFVFPVFEEQDIAFSFKITGTEAEIDALYLAPETIVLGTSADDATFMRNWYTDDGAVPMIWRVNVTTIAVHWPHGVLGLSLMPARQLFTIGLSVGGVWQGVTNALMVVPTNDLSLRIEYSSEDDAFGFFYCGFESSPNKIRIPGTLAKPEFPSEQTVYVKSNGEIKTVTARAGKRYTMDTDYMPEDAHWCVSVALLHNICIVVRGSERLNVRKNGEYEVQWPAMGFPMAKAVVKLDVSHLEDVVGGGCGCDDITQPQMICEDMFLGVVCTNQTLTAQIEVVSPCDILSYDIVQDLTPGGDAIVSGTGLVTFTITDTITMMDFPFVKVEVTCGEETCEVQIIANPYPCF